MSRFGQRCDCQSCMHKAQNTANTTMHTSFCAYICWTNLKSSLMRCVTNGTNHYEIRWQARKTSANSRAPAPISGSCVQSLLGGENVLGIGARRAGAIKGNEILARGRQGSARDRKANNKANKTWHFKGTHESARSRKQRNSNTLLKLLLTSITAHAPEQIL